MSFHRRFLKGLLISSLFIVGALVIGVLGYHYVAGLEWIDALLNAAMILTGMGPVNPLTSVAAKLFATGYALFSGLVFVVASGVLVSPIVHRLLHKFHVDDADMN